MAIMNLVLGSLLLLWYVCSGIGAMMQAANPNQAAFGGPNDKAAVNLDREVAQAVPGYRAYQIGQPLVGLLLSVLLLVSGIGLLNMQRWARTLAILWAVLMILLEVGSTAFHLLIVSPAMTRALRNVPLGPGIPDASVIVGITNVVMVVFAILLSAYALILLLMMLRQTVRAAFAGVPAADTHEPGWIPPDGSGAERPLPGVEGPPPGGGGEQGIRRNPWDY
jgi:hypothetical protein